MGVKIKKVKKDEGDLMEPEDFLKICEILPKLNDFR